MHPLFIEKHQVSPINGELASNVDESVQGMLDMLFDQCSPGLETRLEQIFNLCTQAEVQIHAIERISMYSSALTLLCETYEALSKEKVLIRTVVKNKVVYRYGNGIYCALTFEKLEL